MNSALRNDSPKRTVSVVIPYFNEEENVPILAQQVAAVFDNLVDFECKCLMVNDGSTDETRTAMGKVAGTDNRFRAINLVRNFGQSAALLAGMQRAEGEYILTIDGDLQNDPVDFPAIIQLLANHDCVCGYRVNRNDTWVRKLSSRVANRVRNAVLHDGIRDSGCGTKGFRRRCLQHLVSFNGAHRFFAAVLRNAGMTIAECPVTHHPRQHGVSKYGIHNRLWRGLFDLVGVAWLSKRYVHPLVEGED